MCLHGALWFIPFNLICDTTTSEIFFWTFDPTPGIKNVCKDRICACMVLYAPFFSDLIRNMTTFRKNIILTFNPTPEVEGVCKDKICACMLPHS